MKCTSPLCLFYDEIEVSLKLRKSICLFHDIDINYHNIDKINNCNNHLTKEQNDKKWKKCIANFSEEY